MKKTILRFLALAMVMCLMFTMVACGDKKDPDTDVEQNENNDVENETGDVEDENGETEDEGGDVEDENGDAEGEDGETEDETGDAEDENGDAEDEGSGDADGGNTGGSDSPAYTESGFIVNDPNNDRGLDETKTGFGCGSASNGKPHGAMGGYQSFFDSLENVDALVYDNITQEKVVYLTFDCGYEYNSNTAKLLDILKEKGVKAAFFCTLPFIKGEPTTTARIINEGHILGNHSTTHPSFPTLTRTEMANELHQVHKYVLDTYNYTCSYFRPPMGEYSESSLELCTSLGYRSIFWSFAHRDWITDDQPGKAATLERLKAQLFPGQVLLLHSVSDSNVEALGDYIDYVHSQGYTFKTLDDYPW